MQTDHRYVFISYSSRNYEAAKKLKELLNQHNIDCWLAPGSIPAGSNYAAQIPAAIRDCSAFLLLLTAEAQSSYWVPKELDRAINEKRTVIPFQLDDAELSDSFGFTLCNVQRIMAHGRYEEACEELLHELRELLRKVGALAEMPCLEHEPLLELSMGSAMPADWFVGRGEELRRIEEELTNNRVAFLSGLGGMGKTELALRYGEDYRSAGRGQVYFVRFKKTFDQTVTDNIAPFIPGFSRDGLNEQQILDGAIKYLRRGDPNDLLILDNADNADEGVEELRRELQNLPMRVLVTTRAEDDTAICVGSMEKDTLYEIFRNHKVTISKKEMDDLIAAVDAHTLTVDLMARSMTKGIRRASAQKLLDALKKRDLASGSFTKIGSTYLGAPRQDRINEHLKAVFKVAELFEIEQLLLFCATLLPENGMDPELFLWPFADSDAIADILDALVDRGWLMRKEDKLAIHPVICIVCREVLKPAEENCMAFVMGVYSWYDEKNYDHGRFRQIAELLVNASEALGDPNGWYICPAGYLWNAIGESEQALKCNLRAVELLEQSQPGSNNLAVTYNNVGHSYNALGDDDKALEYQLNALLIQEKVLSSDHPDLAVSYNNIACTYENLGNNAKALEYKLKGLKILETASSREQPALAASYCSIGYSYNKVGDHKKALAYLMKALAIQEEVLSPEHPDLATSYANVGGIYGALGNHAKELKYQKKALAIREKILSPEHSDIAVSCCNLAWTYYKTGSYETALKFMRRAADIAEQSLPEGHPKRVNYQDSLEWLEREARQRAEAE